MPDLSKFFEVLKSEGFSPEMNGEAIEFKYEGGLFIIFPYDLPAGDALYWRMAFPSVYAMGSEDSEELFLASANAASIEVKVVKTVLLNRCVHCLYEAVIPDAEWFRRQLLTALSLLQTAARRFAEELDRMKKA